MRGELPLVSFRKSFLCAFYPSNQIADTPYRISFGWAAGDVSLAAYIQASLARKESTTRNVSALGSVMAFLYTTYIVIYAITSPLLGTYVDNVSKANDDDVSSAMVNIAGVQFTLIAVIMIAATFVPKGAFAFNPDTLYGERLDKDVDSESSSDVDRSEIVNMEKKNGLVGADTPPEKY